MRFYLGTHEPSWLARSEVPLFVSHRRLARRKSMPEAACGWALDSGGFTELKMHGRWEVTEAEYIDAVYRYYFEVGQLEWASPQDWMCEPWVIEGGTHQGQHYAGTGLSVREHQERTVANYLHLREKAPLLPFVPVLQGWEIDDYLACVELYEDAGVNLHRVRVGVGSVCRRQGTAEAETLFRELHHYGLMCHGFGVKLTGLPMYGHLIASADSMAWSYAARRPVMEDGEWVRRPRLDDCTHKTCANCFRWAMKWRREDVLPKASTGQLELDVRGVA